MSEEKVRIEVVQHANTRCLVIEDLRVAGPKCYGGGNILQVWTAKKSDIEKAMGTDSAQLSELKAENLKLRQGLITISHEPCMAYDDCEGQHCDCPRGMALATLGVKIG